MNSIGLLIFEFISTSSSRDGDNASGTNSTLCDAVGVEGCAGVDGKKLLGAVEVEGCGDVDGPKLLGAVDVEGCGDFDGKMLSNAVDVEGCGDFDGKFVSSQPCPALFELTVPSKLVTSSPIGLSVTYDERNSSSVNISLLNGKIPVTRNPL